MDLNISTIDTLLAAHDVKCRAKVGIAKAAGCERVASANLIKILYAAENAGWETKMWTVVTDGLKYANLGTIGSADIMALAFIVIMQASKSAQEDLKEIMAAVKDINETKKKVRGFLERLREKSTTSPYMPWPPTIVIA